MTTAMKWVSANLLPAHISLIGTILTVTTSAAMLFSLIRFFWRLHHCREAVTAEISRLQSRTDSDGVTTTKPEYTYYYNGYKYIAFQKTYSNLSSYAVGEQVKIYVNPERPDQFQDRKHDLKDLIFTLIFAGFFFAFGIKMLLS